MKTPDRLPPDPRSEKRRQAHVEKTQPLVGDFTKMIMSHHPGAVNSASDDRGWELSPPYFNSLRNVLPEFKSLMDFVKTLAKEKGGPLVACDMGGEGGEFFEPMLTEKVVRKSAAFTLASVYKVPRASQPPMGHSVYEVDLLSDAADRVLDSWLDGDKIDVLFERMMGGLNFIPEDPFIPGRKVSDWYERLSETGVMVLQIPKASVAFAKSWFEKMQGVYDAETQLEIRFFEGAKDWKNESHEMAGSPTLLLRKKGPSAPKRLPEINKKTGELVAYDLPF